VLEEGVGCQAADENRQLTENTICSMSTIRSTDGFQVQNRVQDQNPILFFCSGNDRGLKYA
jgi:hypothetical protein